MGQKTDITWLMTNQSLILSITQQKYETRVSTVNQSENRQLSKTKPKRF